MKNQVRDLWQLRTRGRGLLGAFYANLKLGKVPNKHDKQNRSKIQVELNDTSRKILRTVG